MEIIIGLLKDRLEYMNEKLDRKRTRIEKYHLKK